VDIITLRMITLLWINIAVIVFITMFYITAPFGRHSSKKWGRMMNNKQGWFIMELPSFLIMFYFLCFGSKSLQSYTWILFVCWLLHYFNRTFIYPVRIKATQKKMPLFILFSAIFFNVINASLNGYYLAELVPVNKYDATWLTSVHFILGALFLASGMFINLRSDNILIHLRKRGETGYKIPNGFLFEYVASPNLFGEIIEWTGFALMAWNLPAVSFAVWTFANLVPRAKNHYDWNHQHLQGYPKERKVIFPFVY
jgi:3-oxo-5-alpha-steroid 4-dehydrogenase 1